MKSMSHRNAAADANAGSPLQSESEASAFSFNSHKPLMLCAYDLYAYDLETVLRY